jgi:hypothetical protein
MPSKPHQHAHKQTSTAPSTSIKQHPKHESTTPKVSFLPDKKMMPTSSPSSKPHPDTPKNEAPTAAGLRKISSKSHRAAFHNPPAKHRSD